jgi:hypothetical protein
LPPFGVFAGIRCGLLKSGSSFMCCRGSLLRCRGLVFGMFDAFFCAFVKEISGAERGQRGDTSANPSE